MNYTQAPSAGRLIEGDDCIDALSGDSVILIHHPTAFEQLIVAYPGGAVRRIYRDGINVSTGTLCVVKRPDIMVEAREKWNALTPTMRLVVIETSVDRKVLAIKALRELTGLGLMQAKRAIEEFSA